MTPQPNPPEATEQSRLEQSGAPRKRKVWVLAGCAFAALLAIGVLGLGLGQAAPTTESLTTAPTPVVTARIKTLDAFEVQERLAGRIASRRRSDLGFERGGRIAEILVDEGDRVEPGALLATLDTRELQALRRQQRAQRASTKARLELAHVTADRQRRLEASGTLSVQALDEAVAGEASLEAQLAADQAAIEGTEVALGLSRLEAPYAGRIVRRSLDEGSIASGATPVLTILEDGVREVNLGVPPESASRLEIGRAYPIEGGAAEFMGVLRHVLPEIDPVTRTQTAILDVQPQDDAATAIADGSPVWVRLARNVPGQGAWLPIGALAEGRRGTWTAYAVVADEEGITRIERRVVELIHTEEERAFVRGTLRDGEQIVVDGLHRLIPGLEVSLHE